MLEAKNTRVRLSAGYLGLPDQIAENVKLFAKNTVETLFIGNVDKVSHSVEKPDIITKVEVKDGGNRYRNARLDKGYPPNTRLTNLIRDLGDALGLPLGSQQGIPNQNYANGITFSGNVREHLDVLAKTYGLDWSIQDETLQIIPFNQTSKEGAVFLTPDTGLVGSPTKTKEGIQFTSLLQPALKPGRAVKIKSRFINGTFKLKRVVHNGDSQSGSFVSECETSKVK